MLRRTTADLRWFLLALLCLITANALSVSRSGHWTSPPLPQGDGPDYESIAYSIANAQGFQFALGANRVGKPLTENHPLPTNTPNSIERIGQDRPRLDLLFYQPSSLAFTKSYREAQSPSRLFEPFPFLH